MHSHHARFVLLLLVGWAADAGCARPAGGRPDAAVAAAAPDAAAPVARGRRRRRTARVRSAAGASASARATASAGARTHDPGAATAEDLAMVAPPEDEPAPRERPRITETGPMLPEDVGRAPGVSYDLTGGATAGPMGLDEGQIARAMNPLLGRLGRCAEATTDDHGRGPHGRVTVRLRIRPDGHPAAARVTGGGGPPEFITCVRRVVASARFPRFGGPDVLATWGFDVD